tara:strand:+ start:3673 stop:3879 length:207 start_codon:yes stop_codon:yes gene_type:complete
MPSIAYTVQFLCAGIDAIVIGSWFKLFGIGPLILLGAIITGIGAFVVSGMSTHWKILMAYGLLFGFLG